MSATSNDKVYTIVEMFSPAFHMLPMKPVKYRRVCRLLNSLGRKCFPDKRKPGVELARYIAANIEWVLGKEFGAMSVVYETTVYLLVNELCDFISGKRKRSYGCVWNVFRIAKNSIGKESTVQDALNAVTDCLTCESVFCCAYADLLCTELDARSGEHSLHILPEDYDYDEATKDNILKVIEVVRYITEKSGLENYKEIIELLCDEVDAKDRKHFIERRCYRRSVRIASVPVSSWRKFNFMIMFFSGASYHVERLDSNEEYEALGVIDDCAAIAAGVPIGDIIGV